MAVRRATLAAVLTGTLALGVLVGCSNREPVVNKRTHAGTGVASAVNGVQQVVITTGVDLRFHPSTIVVHRGVVRLVLKNIPTEGNGPPHNIQFAGIPADDVPLTAAGNEQSVTFTAPAPGTYSFVCSIHANQGQTGKMIVR